MSAPLRCWKRGTSLTRLTVADIEWVEWPGYADCLRRPYLWSYRALGSWQ